MCYGKRSEKNSRRQFPQKIYASQLLTIDHLQHFKKQLLEELLAAFKSQTGSVPKKWLKSYEVRRLLKISPGTLQTLKSTGIIPYTKIGGVHFYDYEDIQSLLESGKINNKSRQWNAVERRQVIPLIRWTFVDDKAKFFFFFTSKIAAKFL